MAARQRTRTWGRRPSRRPPRGLGSPAAPLGPAAAGPPLAPLGWDAHRARDVALAATALVIFSPLLLVAAVAIKLEGPGSLLFRQRRLGKDQRPFTVLKLRTMMPEAPPGPHERYIARLAGRGEPVDEAALYKLTGDARVTAVGRWLRRLSLDEVPQLLNVLAGDMSMVGPRPALPYELEFYEPRHFERFAVRPGLTGLWQVSGRNRLGFLEMLDLDVEYVRRQSVALDLLILLKTPAALVGQTA
jgi:lipopolysaccharide/colanic/teichoic acid biosynthesis glycosyltransferase